MTSTLEWKECCIDICMSFTMWISYREYNYQYLFSKHNSIPKCPDLGDTHLHLRA